jgi:hypothetical protein
LQAVAVLIFLALIGNLLKPLYWDHVEDFLRRRSDFGSELAGAEDTTGVYETAGGYVTRSGFERFRREVRERYARRQDVEQVRQDLQVNYAAKEALNEQIIFAHAAFDSLSQALQTDYLSRAYSDSLTKGFVTQDRFVSLQRFVQGMNRGRSGGGLMPTPAGRSSFPRRNLWKGFHQVFPPYLTKPGGGR